MTPPDDNLLRRRIVGAIALFAVVFLLSWLIPAPAPVPAPEDEGYVLIPGGRDASTSTDAAVSAGGSGALNAETGERPGATVTRNAQDQMPTGDKALAIAPGESEPIGGDADSQAGRPGPPRETTERRAAPSAPSQPVAPVTPAPRSTETDGNWWVQAASYSDRETAERARDRLRARNTPHRLQDVRINGVTWWRLQAGPFAAKGEAEALARRLQAEGFSGAQAREISP